MTNISIFILLVILGSISAAIGCRALIRFYAAQQGADPTTALSVNAYTSVLMRLLSLLLAACTVGALTNQWTPLNLAPILSEIIEQRFYWPDLWHHIRPGMMIGIHMGFIISAILIYLLSYIVPSELVTTLTHTRQCQGTLSRLLFEGVLTEIIIRWGLLSGVYGISDLIFGKLWWVQLFAVLVTAVLHAASTLPNLYSLYRRCTKADLFVIWFMKSVIGCTFGWIFVKYGLIAVIMSHMCYELVSILADKYRPKWD